VSFNFGDLKLLNGMSEMSKKLPNLCDYPVSSGNERQHFQLLLTNLETSGKKFKIDRVHGDIVGPSLRYSLDANIFGNWFNGS
jgi:hypothetical protein